MILVKVCYLKKVVDQGMLMKYESRQTQDSPALTQNHTPRDLAQELA